MVDRIGFAALKHKYIVKQAQDIVEQHGFEPIQTPILEYSSVFERTLGADSDVVGKELYKFLDSSQQWMTMRPEGTAGVARAIVSNSMESAMPQKLYYAGSMFRHERPQKGRLRQFEQFGIEVFGIRHPAADVECIETAWRFLSSLPIDGRLEVQLNTLGDYESRTAYRESLKNYLEQHKAKLSADSCKRLDTNPLRILDSKDEADIEIVKDAPVYSEFLNAASSKHFDFVKRGLEELQIPYRLNSKLVRGLDYYQHTVWEVTCASELLGRSQATILAGGRYDGLTRALGGSRPLPGIGWAAGIERLALLLPDECIPRKPAPIPILVIPDRAAGSESGGSVRVVKGDLYRYAMRVAQAARRHKGAYVLHPTASAQQQAGKEHKPIAHQPLSKQLSQVLSKTPTPSQVIVVGSDEMAKQQVVVRDTETQEQQTCTCVASPYLPFLFIDPFYLTMKVTITDWRAVAGWRWDVPDDEVCGICRVAFDACCPECKVPGDDCPLIWGECSHVFHMHCLLKWLGTESSQQQCPMDRRPWVTAS
ncbi:hypothetical protein GGI12_001870 [Dipsacomyces acuminosporus]|nr:hypothetical protein GGI12_001870 [Dipsacomyces acuminosporus]